MLYAMSDIHGFYHALQARIDQLGNLHSMIEEGGQDRLIFLGDYIDVGENSFQTLQTVFSLQQACPERVIALRGNHEEWFLDFLHGKDKAWLGADSGFGTSRTFLTNEQFEKVKKMALAGEMHKIEAFVRTCIRENHKELVAWMCTLPYYYEAEKQIFVHAGVDEEAGEWWKVGTSDDCFVNQYPATTGKFYKDIIAGHVATSSLAKDKNFHDIYYDGCSHYYIDGTVSVSGSIPVLVYDECTNQYYSLEKEEHPVCQTLEDRYRVRGALRALKKGL